MARKVRKLWTCPRCGRQFRHARKWHSCRPPTPLAAHFAKSEPQVRESFDAVLAHMVPRETYDYFYDTNDWDDLTGGRPSGWLDGNGVPVPFVSMNNEPESTDPTVLEHRYASELRELWLFRSAG
mgnify:CR=1 FL=1